MDDEQDGVLSASVEYQTFQKMYRALLSAVRSDLSEVASALFTDDLINFDTKVKAETDRQASVLLDSLILRIETEPEVFNRIVDTLESVGPTLKHLAKSMREVKAQLQEEEERKNNDSEITVPVSSLHASRRPPFPSSETSSPLMVSTERRIDDDPVNSPLVVNQGFTPQRFIGHGDVAEPSIPSVTPSTLLLEERSVPTEAQSVGLSVGIRQSLGPALHPQLNVQHPIANGLPPSDRGDNENSTYVVLKPRAGSLSHVKTMSSENESQVSSTCEHDQFHEEREGSIAQESDDQHFAESLVGTQQTLELETSGLESAVESKTKVSSNDLHSKVHELESTLTLHQVAIDGLQRQNLDFSHSYQHPMRKFAEKHKTVEPCLCTCRQYQGISSRRSVDLTLEQLTRDYDRLKEDYDYLQMKYKISEQYLRDENVRLTEKLITTEAKMIALQSCKLETAHQAQCPK